MNYITELQHLVLVWLERMSNPEQPVPYKDAINECIYDLNSVIDKAIEEQLDYQQILAESAADDYWSSMEAYEDVV